MERFLRYDDAAMWTEACGPAGNGREAFLAESRRLVPAVKELAAMAKTQGWLTAPEDRKALLAVKRHAASARKRFDRLIVVGIGGSDLSARTLAQAVGNPARGMELLFASAPDPDALSRFADQPKSWWARTAVNIVSKSGTTLETLSVGAFIVDRLKAAVASGHARQVFVTTEENEGPLHRIAASEGYALLPHPKHVGGRYSALTVVGLFPAACAGARVERLHAGARTVMREWRHAGVKHDASVFAAHMALALQKGRHVQVLMPYADTLSGLGPWYRQIWAESLGKRRGDTHVGPTPVAAMGPVDQHSQIQLYNEGPTDKVVTFVEVEAFRSKRRVPKPWPSVPEAARLAKLEFGAVMRAELEGTARALTAHGRPNGRLIVPNVNEETVGALLQFFMLSTALTASLLGVNAFDQPGVEEGKRQTRAIMGV